MLGANAIKSKEYWHQQFGLYPMLMKPKISKNKFLMLNGGNNDFCLQTDYNNENDERENFFSESWSTNTKHFLAIYNDIVYVYNWINNKTENYSLEKIEANPSSFYGYLASQSYKTSNDAVPFILSIFRELRNLTKKKEPVEALNLLFRLLISIKDDYTKINTTQWEIIDSKVPANFDYYVERIRQGVNSISPDRDLILRHISGILFQEAHKEVIYFDPQMDLFGGYSDTIKVKDELYSSVHYTPQYLARSIVENCLKQIDLQHKEGLIIFDPACGSSEFLIETLKQLKNIDYQGKVKVIGWDTSSSAVCTSKFLLKYEQLTLWNDNNLEFEIRQVADSLTEQWDNNYDMIVMNPPFVSWEILKKNSRDAVSNVLGPTHEGKPNQAAAFFYKAVKTLQSKGVLGCVLPYTIFTSDSYSKLRKQTSEELSLNLLAKLGNYVFESVLTDVCFFIGKKSQHSVLPKLIWSKNEKGITSEALLNLRKMEIANKVAIEDKKYNIYIPFRFPVISDSWKIISIKEDQFINDVKRFVLNGQLAVVNELFSVQQGIRQGIKDIFKIKKEEYKLLPKDEKKYFRPVIDNDAISDGQLFDYRYIWYPYNQSGLMFKNEKEMKHISFFIDNLKPYKSDLMKRAGIQEWWGHTRPRNWQFIKQMKLVSTEYGRSDSFAIDKTGNFVVERGCAWIPKKAFFIDDYYFYLAYFSSDIFDFLLSIYSKQIQSGYYLGQTYTKNIPIPNVNLQDERQSERYSRLAELGKELENGNPYVKHSIRDVVKIYYPNI